MSTKTTNSASTPDAGASSPQDLPPLQEPCNVIVTVLRDKAQVGDIICAQGVRIYVTQSQADQLASLGFVRVEGVQ